MLKVIAVAPMPEPITGQSLASLVFVEGSKHDIDVLDTNIEGCNILKKFVKWFFLSFRLIYMCVMLRPDVLYFTCSRSTLGSFRDILTILISKVFSIKIVNHIHGSDFASFINKSGFVYSKVLKMAHNLVDVHIALTDSMRNEVLNILGRQLVVDIVPNTSERFSDGGFGKEYSGSVQIVYLSNIIYSKGIFVLLESLQEIFEKGYRFNVKIAGKFMPDEYMSASEVESEFKSILSRFPDGCVEYLGVVKGNEKFSLLEKSDIFCLPTFYKSEAFPISIVEAMSNSCAIVSTKFRYLPEILNEDFAILCEPESVTDVASALTFLISNKLDLNNMKRSAYYTAKSKYSSSSFVSKIDKVIENTCK